MAADERPDTYDLDDGPAPAPPLPGQVEVESELNDLIDVVAAELMVHAQNCVRAFGDFHLALSGGSTPIPLYERLMYDPVLRSFPWTRTHLWIVDEPLRPPSTTRSRTTGTSGRSSSTTRASRPSRSIPCG